MYNKVATTLSDDIVILEQKILVALAHGNHEEYTLLQIQKSILDKQLRSEQKKAQKDLLKEKQQQTEQIENTKRLRLQKTKDQLSILSYTDSDVEVFQGFEKEKLRFKFSELLEKIITILKKKKSFSVGDQYSGKLTVKKVSSTILFQYYYNNRDQREFTLEVSHYNTLEQFIKNILLISCRTEPEIGRGVGHNTITEEYYIYSGKDIITDLFTSFADGLYYKKEK